MYSDIIKVKLEFCVEHILVIEGYTQNINTPDEFIKQYNGLVYDGTLMRLQALGESLKGIAVKHPEVIDDLNYPDISDVIKFRDYVSHHYEMVEHEIVYNIIRNDIPKLKECLLRLIN